jgi:hypothetical protein
LRDAPLVREMQIVPTEQPRDFTDPHARIRRNDGHHAPGFVLEDHRLGELVLGDMRHSGRLRARAAVRVGADFVVRAALFKVTGQAWCNRHGCLRAQVDRSAGAARRRRRTSLRRSTLACQPAIARGSPRSPGQRRTAGRTRSRRGPAAESCPAPGPSAPAAERRTP